MTLLLLRHVVRSSRPASLCLVATYRESELGRTHPLAEMLADFRREPMVTRVSLRGLDERDVEGLLGALAGEAAPTQLARVVSESTGGNPFFVSDSQTDSSSSAYRTASFSGMARPSDQAALNVRSSRDSRVTFR